MNLLSENVRLQGFFFSPRQKGNGDETTQCWALGFGLVFLWYNRTLQLFWGQLPYVISVTFFLHIALFPRYVFKEGSQSFGVCCFFFLHFLNLHGTSSSSSSFLCWVQGWIVQLEHKMLFHGTPTMHLWTPCYAWTTDCWPTEGQLSFVSRAGTPLPPPPPSPPSPTRQPSVFLQNLAVIPQRDGEPQPYKDCFHLVMTRTLSCGTCVGFLLVRRNSRVSGERKLRRDRPNQSSIRTI